MSQPKTILVTGATGQQGGAVARALLQKGQRVKALTRDPDKAAVLKELGIDLVKGDLSDTASLETALQGVDGVFGVTTFFEKGMEGEVQQGINLANASAKHKIKHFVFTSVGSANRGTNIPHFETKWKIEQHIRSLKLPATILRPVWFMENFGTYFPPTPEGVLSLPLHPETVLHMIAVDDIGEFGATAFLKPDLFLGQAIDLAGDALTMPEVATLLTQAKGQSITFQQLPDNVALEKMGPDMTAMFQWFNKVGYAVDVSSLKQRFGIPLMSFKDFILGSNS